MGDAVFSVAANSFAVVGLADVVARLSITAIDFYIRYRNASKDIDRMLLELRTLASIVQRVRDWANDYNHSTYVLDDGNVLLPELQDTLQNCAKELGGLIQVSQHAKRGANEGWVKSLSKGIWWAKGDQEFQKSCQTIQRLNATLNTALSLMGRQNDLAVRKEFDAMRSELTSTRSALNQSSQSIISEAQRASTGIQSLHESNSTLLVKFDNSFNSTQAELRDINTTITNHVTTLGRRLSSIDKALTKNAVNQHTFFRQQNGSFSHVVGRLDELSLQFATIGLTNNQKNAIVFDGQHPGAITLPLELMRSHLENAIQTLVADGKMTLSEVKWLESELENILACGHEAAALASRHKSATRQNKSIDCRGSPNLFALSSFEKGSSEVAWRDLYSEVSAFQQNSVRRVQDWRKFQTPVGSLIVETCRTYSGNPTYNGPSFSSLGVSFTPNAQLASCIITTRFSKLSIPSVELKITRAVQMYNVIPQDSKTLQYVVNNDVQGLKSLFEAGQASVYDCNEYGTSLLMLAANSMCVETYEYLLRQGASSHYSTEGFVLLHFIWIAVTQSFATSKVIKQVRRMTSSAIQQGCDPNDTVHGENLLHFIAGGQSCLKDTMLLETCSYLLAIGCELEQRDNWERTPLLAAGYFGNSKMSRILFSIGADPNACDTSHRGVLHTIFTGVFENHHRLYRDLLETALLGGCDPNSLDINGFSPSDYSEWYGCWATWIKALDLKGYTPVKIELRPRKDTTWVVLLKEALNSQTLPISNLAIDKWIESRNRINSSTGYTPLHQAVRNGYAETVVSLLKSNIDVNCTSSQGWTPLHLAVYHGHMEIAKQLHIKGAQLEVQTNDGIAPLHQAARNGQSDIVAWLLELNVDVDCASNNSWTPLHFAAYNGHLNVAKQLHAKRAQLEPQIKDGFTPLLQAAQNGYFDMVAWLTELNVKVNYASNDGWTSLHLAAWKGHLEIAKLLYAKGAQINAQSKGGLTPLDQATLAGHSDIVAWLIQLNANVNCESNNGWTSLHYAAEKGYLNIAKQLHANGAQINAQSKDGFVPLHLAARNGHSNVVAWLIKDLNIDANYTSNGGWTSLHYAAEKGYLNIAKQLYANGAQINAQSKDGVVPLHLAARNSHSNVVVWLIKELNTDANYMSNDGWTPLHLAAENGYLEVAKQLHANGAQINAQSKDGIVPLHLAARNGHSNVVAWLIKDLNMDANYMSNDGWTPLHLAAAKGRLTVVNELIELQANAKFESSNGWTPLHIAAQGGHLAVANRLMGLGADPNQYSNFGSTAFHCAAYHGQIAVLEMFLQSSGDPWLLDGYGRNILDWASTYQPAFQVMKGLHQSYEPTNQGTISQHLTMSIRKLFQSTQSGNDWLEFIGCLFIHIGDDLEATTAFEQGISSDRGDSTIVHQAECNMCENSPIQGLRYVCRVCVYTSLCESCMVRYNEGESVRNCDKHTFLKIPSQTWNFLKPLQVNEVGETLEQWLKRLKQRWIADLPGH